MSSPHLPRAHLQATAVATHFLPGFNHLPAAPLPGWGSSLPGSSVSSRLLRGSPSVTGQAYACCFPTVTPALNPTSSLGSHGPCPADILSAGHRAGGNNNSLHVTGLLGGLNVLMNTLGIKGTGKCCICKLPCYRCIQVVTGRPLKLEPMVA